MIADKYSDIKNYSYSLNTTSRLQPLDLGIIQNFKVDYRKLLLCFVLDETDEMASQVRSNESVSTHKVGSRSLGTE